LFIVGHLNVERRVPLPPSTGWHVSGSPARKIEEFFLEEVPPPLSTGWHVLRTHHYSKIPDLLDWKILPSHFVSRDTPA